MRRRGTITLADGPPQNTREPFSVSSLFALCETHATERHTAPRAHDMSDGATCKQLPRARVCVCVCASVGSCPWVCEVLKLTALVLEF